VAGTGLFGWRASSLDGIDPDSLVWSVVSRREKMTVVALAAVGPDLDTMGAGSAKAKASQSEPCHSRGIAGKSFAEQALGLWGTVLFDYSRRISGLPRYGQKTPVPWSSRARFMFYGDVGSLRDLRA
jgi:hypothetical protein